MVEFFINLKNLLSQKNLKIMITKNLFFIRIIIFFTIVLEGCRFSSNYNGNFLDKTIYDLRAPILAEVLMHLQLDYYNQEKLDPQILLSGALTELERIIPEIWISPELDLDQKKKRLNIVCKQILHFLHFLVYQDYFFHNV